MVKRPIMGNQFIEDGETRLGRGEFDLHTLE